MTDFKKINEARKILKLEENVTLEEIKNAYRELALKYQPDRCKGKNKKKYEEMFKKITNAKNTIMDYCINYKFSFAEKEIEKNTKEKELKEHLDRFYNGWWGDLDL